MFNVLKLVIVLLVVGVFYLALWPVPIEPKVWQPSDNPGYVDEFSVNERLESFEALYMGEQTGPEAAILVANGDVVATSHEGWLVRFNGGEQTAAPWVDVGGRPLGLDADSQGNIWVANAYKGLQKVTAEGVISLELDTVEGTKIGYADDVTVSKNGKIYFSDATTRFHAKDWGGTLSASILDIVEHGKTGRVIEFDPVSKSAKVVLKGLNFANGVASDPNGQFILVNETGEYRVWRLWVAGVNKGKSEVLLEGLPGFPDNVSAGRNGVFWIGVVSPRSNDIDKFASKPFWRKLIIRLPESMKPQPEDYGMVLGINSDGEVLHNLQAPSGKVYSTTGVLEDAKYLYVTSLTAPFLARVSKKDAGL